MAETVAALVSAHRTGTLTPEETVARTYDRIRRHDDPAIFIHLRPEAEAIAEARELSSEDGVSLPLFGIPVAIKDNIDVGGMPTTSACEAFKYTPSKDATAVAKLRAAGAIIVGKTNLDQFATGLVGVRRPMASRAMRSGRTSFPAVPVPAPLSRSLPAWCRWHSAQIPPDRAACRRASII